MFIIVIYLTLTIISDKKSITEHEPVALIPSYDISFQVLNGCGKPGLALSVRNELVDMGFDVISIDNAEKFIYRRTVLIIRKMNMEKLEAVKKQLNISNIYMQIKEDSLYDFILILGSDYKEYFKDVK